MYDDLIQQASLAYSVPAAWIKAVIQTESSWDAKAYRAEPQIQDGSYGLMQLLYKTAQGLGYNGAPNGLYDPKVNIDLGSKLLGQLRQRYGDDFRNIYSAYNSGNSNAWTTNSTVAAHVARAVAALETYIMEASQQVTATTGASGSTQASLAGLLALVLLWAWTGKKR